DTVRLQHPPAADEDKQDKRGGILRIKAHVKQVEGEAAGTGQQEDETRPVKCIVPGDASQRRKAEGPDAGRKRPRSRPEIRGMTRKDARMVVAVVPEQEA